MTDTPDTSTTLLGSEPAPQAAPGQSPAPDTAPALAPNGGATPEPATGAGDSAQETKPAPVVPENYEFKAPEGMELDTAAVEAFTPLAKELGLTNEQAQKIADLYAGQMGRVMAQVQEAQATQEAAWVGEVKADPEIGGAKLEGNLSVAAKAIDAFGGADLRQALTVTGAGNHPAVVRAFVKIGKAISEDGFVRGNSADPGGGKSAAELFYPSQTKGN